MFLWEAYLHYMQAKAAEKQVRLDDLFQSINDLINNMKDNNQSDKRDHIRRYYLRNIKLKKSEIPSVE